MIVCIVVAYSIMYICVWNQKASMCFTVLHMTYICYDDGTMMYGCMYI